MTVMKFFRHIPQSGQTLLETIVALGIIATATTATVSLLLASMKAGTTSSNRVIAANLARETIEAARDIRDSNWLKIQANEPGASTFDGLFDEANPHHVRFPVFNNPMSDTNYYCRANNGEEPGQYRNLATPSQHESRNIWSMEDVNFTGNCGVNELQACFKNYNGTEYNIPIPYQLNHGEDTLCKYKYSDAPAGILEVPCSTVFENKDPRYWKVRYFNQMPELDNPLVDETFKNYISGCTIDPDAIEPTKPTIFRRWVVFDPICRMDNGSGLPNVWPQNEQLEKIIVDDNQTCVSGDILVGLRVRSYVTWVDNTTTPDKPHEVALEDRLYNWKYVK